MEDYEALHNFALRLLESQTDFEPGGRLLPGRIPPNLPIDLPIPPSTRIFGGWAGAGRSFVLLETDLDARAVDTFYRQKLSAQGLHELDLSHPAFFDSGVEEDMRGDLSLTDREVDALEGNDWAQGTYRIGDNGPTVMVRAQQDQQGPRPTTVEIEVGVHLSEWDLDEKFSDVRESAERIHRLLPVLPPPAGVQTWGGAENWGSEDAHVEATMFTDLPVQDVANHFNPQIAAEGWSEVASGVSDRVGWSQWEREEESIGTIELLWFALQLPTTPPEYILRLHAIKRNPQRPWNRTGTFGSRIAFRSGA